MNGPFEHIEHLSLPIDLISDYRHNRIGFHRLHLRNLTPPWKLLVQIRFLYLGWIFLFITTHNMREFTQFGDRFIIVHRRVWSCNIRILLTCIAYGLTTNTINRVLSIILAASKRFVFALKFSALLWALKRSADEIEFTLKPHWTIWLKSIFFCSRFSVNQLQSFNVLHTPMAFVCNVHGLPSDE